MKKVAIVFLCSLVFLLIASFSPAAETIRRSILWTLEGNNDPIVQITNESADAKTLSVRVLIGTDTYRYPLDLDVPAGENRFLRVREVLDAIGKRYPEIKKQLTGLLQFEFDGTEEEVKTRMVNLNPKVGVTSEKDADRTLAPSIGSLDPKSGAIGGGTVVTITGRNFSDSTAVKFGGIPALHNRQSEDVLIAVTPPHSPGAVDVEVTNGKKSDRLPKGYEYQAEGPVILEVHPETGPAKGGTAVRITGHNFQSGITAYWDGAPITAKYLGSEILSLITPPGHSGSISVEVRNPEGKNFLLPDAFTYRGAPRALSVSPQMASRAGGTMLTVSGENFEPGCSVLFGSQYAPTTFINPHAIAAIVPAGDSSGQIDITVSAPDGETSTLNGAFLYNDPPHIESVKADPNPMVRLTTSTITVLASDPEGGPLNYDYQVTLGPGGCTVLAHGDTATFNSPNTTGSAVVQVTVSDQHGARVQTTLTLTVE
jgi:hypothetical protein